MTDCGALQKIIDTFSNWIDLTSGIVSGLAPFLGMIADLGSEFSDLDSDTTGVVGSILGWGKAINTVAGFIPNLTGPLTVLAAGFNLLTITRIPALAKGLTSMLPPLGGFGTALGVAAKGAAAFGLGWTVGTVLREHIPVVKDAGDKLGELAYALFGSGDEAATAMEKQAAHTQELADAALEMVRVKEATEGVIDLDDPIVKVDTELANFFTEIDQVTWNLQNLDGYKVETIADMDITDVTDKIETVKVIVDGVEMDIPVEIDPENKAASDAEEVKKEIDEKLPSEKLLEIKLQGEIDIELEKIKTAAETLQASFEWEGKIEIANIEADAKRIEAIAATIGIAWESTGDVISSAFGVLSDPNLPLGDYLAIVRLIETESERRGELLVLQKQLTEAEIEHIKARTQAIQKGQGMITISADGIEPELELVLQKIIKLAQIQANEEGFGMLLGV